MARWRMGSEILRSVAFDNEMGNHKVENLTYNNHVFSIVLSSQNIFLVSDCTLASKVITHFKRRTFFILYHDRRPIHKKRII